MIIKKKKKKSTAKEHKIQSYIYSFQAVNPHTPEQCSIKTLTKIFLGETLSTPLICIYSKMNICDMVKLIMEQMMKMTISNWLDLQHWPFNDRLEPLF